MLDTARNLCVPLCPLFEPWSDAVLLYSFPIPDIVRTLDAMSWVKINTFHWHITDGQSFPLEVAQYPGLAVNGAYSAEQTYSTSDVQYIVQYAASVRHVSFSFDASLKLISHS